MTYQQSIREKAIPKLISIWIEFNTDYDPHIFYCHACRNPIMQYQGEVIMELPSNHPSKMPLIIQCKNQTCKRRYNIIGYVLEENNK